MAAGRPGRRLGVVACRARTRTFHNDMQRGLDRAACRPFYCAKMDFKTRTKLKRLAAFESLLPPSDKDVEREALGYLLEGKRAPLAFRFLCEGDFYCEPYRNLFVMLREIFNRRVADRKVAWEEACAFAATIKVSKKEALSDEMVTAACRSLWRLRCRRAQLEAAEQIYLAYGAADWADLAATLVEGVRAIQKGPDGLNGDTTKCEAKQEDNS